MMNGATENAEELRKKEVEAEARLAEAAEVRQQREALEAKV